ncbi:MAG TPA: hypothetical protein VI197_09180 [Polyangiaceae bacterium]
MKAFRAIIHTTLFTLLSVGCATILGIEDAELANDGAGGTSGGGTNGSGGSAGGAGAEASCEDYCDAVMENCTGERAMYSGLQNCLDLCGTLPVGDPGDPQGNTVACRLAEATAAGEDPEEHCPFAGLGGAKVCGENCPAFCGAMLEICPGKYPSNAACLDDCESLDDLGSFKLTDTEGDTVQCRIYHVNAATELTDPHCRHAAGEQLCVP